MYSQAVANGWTTDECDRLRNLIQSGATSSQIAAHFPGKTRNAILGKAFRLGLRLLGSRTLTTFKSFWSHGDRLRELAGYLESPQGFSQAEIARRFGVGAATIKRGMKKLGNHQSIKPLKPNAASIARRADAVAGLMPARKRPRVRKRTMEELMAANTQRPAPELVPEPVPYCAVEIADLTSLTCRWPVEGQGYAMRYCGRIPTAGFPYCPWHCRMAYQPAR